MKIIDLLLRLYPAEFQARFGAEMRAFHDARVREEGDRRSWLRIVADHIGAAVREQWHALRPDVRYALRSVRRRPAFAAVIVGSIALGVGANVAIFSVAHGVLVRALPYAHADRVFTLAHEPPHWLLSEPQLAEYRNKLHGVESLAAFTSREGNIAVGTDPERVALAYVTREFFSTLGAGPVLGRGFTPGEDEIRPARSVIISHALWQRSFGGDSAVLGQTLMLNAVPRTIVGVMPVDFQYPSSATALWLPICSQRRCTSLSTNEPDTLDGWATHYLSVIGLARAGVDIDRVGAEAASIARGIMRALPYTFTTAVPLIPVVRSLRDSIVGNTRPYIVALFGAVVFLLLIVCVNVANLLLARGESRRREMALRTAIGASRQRLVTQLMTESIVLALLGGALGLGLGWVGTRALRAMAPGSIPRADQIVLDATVVAFAFGVSLVAGVLFAVIPALRSSVHAPGDTLKSAGKGATHHAGTSGSSRARRVLVIAEIAVAMVLLSGAGMLVRSLSNLQRADLGFVPEGALTLRVSLNATGYDDTRMIQFYRELVDRLHAIPGVRAAGAARWLPVVEAGGLWDVVIEGVTPPPGQTPTAVPQEVTPGYFAAAGMRLLAGRDFGERDGQDAPLVGIVSRGFARRAWGDENVLGRRFRLGRSDKTWVSVVGIVDDIRARGYANTPEPSMYLPHAQTSFSNYFVPSSMAVVVRTRGAPMAYANAVRSVVRSLDASAPVSSVRTLENIASSAVAIRRFATSLIAAFGVLALVLAGIGIFGVVSYGVSQRTFEIGLRMALGADRWRVVRLVVRDAAVLALIGVAAGLFGSAVLGRAMRSLLFEVPGVDVMSLLSVAVILIVVALGAAMLPALRAASVLPTDALRSSG